MKAISESCNDKNHSLIALSLHDNENDTRYIKSDNFKAFKSNRLGFIFNVIRECLNSNVIILGHINLYPIGLLLKILGKNIILITHGIEVWNSLAFFKKNLLLKSNMIICVSDFTKKRILNNLNIDSTKIKIIHNTIDPFFNKNVNRSTRRNIKTKYSIKPSTKVLLTVSRMGYWDREKGYETVLKIIPKLKDTFNDLKYFLIGPADNDEILRISKLANDLSISSNLHILTDVSEKELPGFYNVADLFVMPSKKEGFGIAYLESLACGTPVIAGNMDGSVEPLLNGKLGLLIDPDDIDELTKKIINVFNNKEIKNLTDPEYLSTRVYEEFGFDKFKSRLEKTLFRCLKNQKLH